MTTHYTPPEDAFDQWLDALVDGAQYPTNDDRADAAAFLQRHFGMPQADEAPVSPDVRATMFKRAVPHAHPGTTPERPSNATGATRIIPIDRTRPAWRVVSLAAAAVLALIALATIAAFLRLDDEDQGGGVGATASMLPFAPASALASPTPVANCTTSDTLLLTPEEPAEPGAFAELPFQVAWYSDGMLTVERGGEVAREIAVGEASILTSTAVPNVILASESSPGFEERHARFVNIATGDLFEIERYHRLVDTNGPFVFWASDRSYARWHAVDLRTFETVDLSEMFNITPLQPWRPYVRDWAASNDGTVLLVGTTTFTPVNATVSPATPVTTDGPELRLAQDGLLVTGNLDNISIVGPLATASGAMTLSPDGETMAWLALSDQRGEHILTIAETVTGETISERPVEATYSNSLLFSADGSLLYSTSGTTLERIAVHPDAATPDASLEPITLPDTAYRILGASSDREQLLLARTQHASGEVSIWLDVQTGEMREIEGTPGRMWESSFPSRVAPNIARHLLVDDLMENVRILDMTTGEIILMGDRDDGGAAIVVSPDGSAIIAPHQHSIDWLDIDSGDTTTIAAPDNAQELPQPIALTSEGACALVTWRLDDGSVETALLSARGADQTPLPPSINGGWVPSD